MIRYRFVLLGHRLIPFAKFASVNEVNAYLREREHHLIYIEVQAYDDRKWMERPAWTNETVSNREWFDDHHDQLYKMIEDYGHRIDLENELKLHADIRQATAIRYHQPLNIYLLSRDDKLFCRLPMGQILESAIAKDFHKVEHRHWKRHTLDLFYDLESA